MFGLEPISPAYGNDSQLRSKIIEDLLAGRDFKAANGQYCSIRDLRELGLKQIRIRHNRLADTFVFDIPPDSPPE